jgi:hypothetical protein
MPAGLLVMVPLPQPSIQTLKVAWAPAGIVVVVVVGGTVVVVGGTVVVVGGTVVVVGGTVLVVVEVLVVVVVLLAVVVVAGGRGFATAAEGRSAIKATTQTNVAT